MTLNDLERRNSPYFSKQPATALLLCVDIVTPLSIHTRRSRTEDTGWMLLPQIITRSLGDCVIRRGESHQSISVFLSTLTSLRTVNITPLKLLRWLSENILSWSVS